jgi:plastocyanin
MKISYPLAVCCAAAAVTAGALFTGPDTAKAPPAAPVTTSADGSPAPAPAPSPSAAQVTGGTVVIADFAFVATEVGAGSVVSVRNDDGATHTVTGDGFDVSVDPGATGTFVAPATPGTYDYVCAIHPSMKAKLVVK